MSCQGATTKDVLSGARFFLAVSNFESTYILFKFFHQQLFLHADYKFLLREASHSPLDIVDFCCNTECSIRQLELNISKSNYHAIKI